MPNTLAGPYSKTAWVDHVTLGNQTRMNNLESQAGVALGSLNSDVVATGFILSGSAASRHNSYASTVLADTPARYYRMDAASGVQDLDQSGNSLPVVFTNAPTLNAASLLTGDPDAAVTFASASSQYGASTSSSGLPTGSGNASIEAWIKVSGAPGGTQIIAEIGDPAVAAHRLCLQLTTSLTVQLTNGTVTITSGAISTGSPHHLVGTWDGTSFRLYIDSALAAGPTAAAMTWSYTGNALTIATASGATPGNFFSGTVDEVAVYTAALSAARVTAHYTNGTTATTQVDIASGSAYLLQTDGNLTRCTIVSTTQTTATINSTYNLYLQPDGTWYWSTSNSPAANSLQIATVTTDGSGNVKLVTDLRSMTITLFPNATGALSSPRVVAQTAAAGVSVSSTSDQVILTYTPPIDGWYRINAQIQYSNGTPGKPTINTHFVGSDTGSYSTNYFFSAQDGQWYNGSQANVTGNNQEILFTPLSLRAKAGQLFTVHFQDSGGTPADIVHVFIERLS